MPNRLKTLAYTGLSLALIMALQIVGLPNLLTGIAVNAVFIFTICFLGLRPALFLGFLSPVGGLFSGHLPAVMYPVLPVIMVGNLGFIFVYSHLKQSGRLLRYLIPSAVKAVWIFAVGMLVIQFMELSGNVKWLIVPVLGIQFLTAFAGTLVGEKLGTQLPSEL